MGDHAKKQDDAKDSYELGPVEHVNDLQPETGVGATRKAKAQSHLVEPTADGYFEMEGGASDQLAAPLHIGPDLKKDGGPVIGEYEAAYNAYAMPLRSTLRAMGRVKDVSLTGAPLTPAELMQRPALAARFRKLTPATTSVEQDLAYDAWSAQQTNMKIDVQRFGAGQHEMASVVANYRRIQELLQQRQLEAEKGSKTRELAEIKETAATLARITEVSAEAWGAMGAVEDVIAQQTAFDPNAEGIGSDHDLPQSNNPDWPHGTADNPTGAGMARRSQGQRVADGANDLSNAAMAIIASAKQRLKTTGRFELSLQDMFTVLRKDGADKYKHLQDDLVLLDAHIKKLGLEQEAQLVLSAKTQLVGFTMEFGARTQDVRAERVAARKGARTFAKSVGADTDGITAMYAAEAYQELAAFGHLAAQDRRDMVDPLWGRVHGYLHGYDVHRFVAIGALADATTLDTNLRAVQEQRAYLDRHVPEWQQVAKQWSEFLHDHTGATLIAEENKADRRSGGAP